MASISRDKLGRRRIIFVGADRVRRTIYLGKFPHKAAETIQRHVEALLSSLNSRSPLETETADWLGKIGDDLHKKLVKVRLVQPRLEAAASARTLEALRTAFSGAKLKAKPDTRVHWGHTWRNLLGFFGADKDIASINAADAETWAEWLDVGEKLSIPTVHKRCGNAKQFFSFARKSGWIPSNPFADLKSGNITNREKDFFLSREDAQRVIDACPDAEWRLLFALSRYGGLRCPSEHLGLRWADVDWQKGRIRVTSPKTEHHQGGKSRMIPIFPELRPFLDEAWEQATEGAEFVIARYRDAKQNLRTQLKRIIRRAGLEPWPKLFQNLRATRQTEVEEDFPSHVVCAWLGNSVRVARKHYLQVTEAHFDRAIAKTTRQTAQQMLERAGERGSQSVETKTKTPEIPAENAAFSGVSEVQAMGDAGLEPATSWV
jgi:integrase